jgi:hypothetical protein
MCDDGISHEQYEQLRQAFATLRAASLQVLACAGRPTATDTTEAFAALRAAARVDPASFVIAAPPSFHMVLKPNLPNGPSNIKER